MQRPRDEKGRFRPLFDQDDTDLLFIEHLPGVNFPFVYPDDRGLSFSDFCSDDDPADSLPVVNAVLIA